MTEVHGRRGERLGVLGVLVLATSVSLLGCPQDDDIDCGPQECPVGTAYDEYQAQREGYDVDTVYDDSFHHAAVAYRTFGEAECRYQCVAIQECPAETVPVITEDCFTCGTWNDSEELEVPDCGS